MARIERQRIFVGPDEMTEDERELRGLGPRLTMPRAPLESVLILPIVQIQDEGPPSIYALLVAETRVSLSEVRALGRKHPEMLYSLEAWEARLLNLLKKVEEV